MNNDELSVYPIHWAGMEPLSRKRRHTHLFI